MHGEITNEAIDNAWLYASKALTSFKILGIFASVWFLAILIISIVIFVFTLLRGTKGKNSYDVVDVANKKSESDDIGAFVGLTAISEIHSYKVNGEKKMKILKCSKCGKVVCVFSDSANPDMYCCGVVMNELKANTTDAAVEKHVPVVEKNGSIVSVKVGSAAHPMIAEHYIDWILLVGTKNAQLANVKGKDTAAASFVLSDDEDVDNVYAYCNLHGLWAIK